MRFQTVVYMYLHTSTRFNTELAYHEGEIESLLVSKVQGVFRLFSEGVLHYD